MTVIEQATRWMADDPDPKTQAATQAMIDAGNTEDLNRFFGRRLQFGTAGMRGPIGPGPGGMNQATVRRVTAGLGRYLLDMTQDASTKGVAIGFDGRHGSRIFAEDAARVLGGLGIRTYTYDDVVSTPELAHAVLNLGCAGGIMVTASHNPPADNGYKVYWGNGAQIIPPHDTGISERIDGITSLADIKIPDLNTLQADKLVQKVPAKVLEDYLAAVQALRVTQGGPLRIVYTAMHGVGRRPVEAVLSQAGYTDLHVVPSQADPDPDFPTVAFPNPEEPGALDLALALAKKVDADLVVANDPDADRLAVAIPNGDGYRLLSGNQIGVLLAETLLSQTEGSNRLVATTVVSTTLLAKIAAHHGVSYIETLTGFKWIATAAIAHDAAGGRFIVGFEEAIGYSVGPVVRDKDGISALLIFCDLAAQLKAEGRTLLDALTDIYRIHGVHSSRQKSVKLPGTEGAARIQRIMAALRDTPPTDVDGIAVIARKDLLTGQSIDLRTGITSEVDLPRSNVLAFDLADGTQILARPSGTEPKIKFYFEICTPLGKTLAGTEAQAEQRLDTLIDAFSTAALTVK